MKKLVIGVIGSVLVMVLCLSPCLSGAALAGDIEIPKVPIVGPVVAMVIEAGKIAVSPVTQLADQARNGYRGWPFSIATEAINGATRIAIDGYQAAAPWEWAMNKPLYCPPTKAVTSGPGPVVP